MRRLSDFSKAGISGIRYGSIIFLKFRMSGIHFTGDNHPNGYRLRMLEE